MLGGAYSKERRRSGSAATPPPAPRPAPPLPPHKMPFVELETNVPPAQLPRDLPARLSAAAAAILGKPEERVAATVKGELALSMGGSAAPGALLSVWAVGAVGSAEQNRTHSARFAEFLARELRLGADRIWIRFHPLEPRQVGKEGTVMTFL